MSRTETDPPIATGAADSIVVVAEVAGSSRRRHRWWWLAFPLGAIILTVVGVLFTHTGFFSAERIRVTGATHLSAQQVIRESGVTRQTNVVYLDPTEVEA